jgi:hypothetical protein
MADTVDLLGGMNNARILPLDALPLGDLFLAILLLALF